MRLRSIIRKRMKRKGQGRGRDHYIWPNAFFKERGLFSLVDARAQDSQSLKKVNHQLESRMRENRGSEGGGAERLSLPLSFENW
jgi:hypothetical protein